MYHTDVENDLNDCPGEGWEEGMVRQFGMDMYTLLCLKWITRGFPGGSV